MATNANSDNWTDPDSDLSVRRQIACWMIFDGEACMFSMGVFRHREEAIAVARWWLKMGCPVIKRRRVLA